MARALVADASSVGVEDYFSGVFTKAVYLRSKQSILLEQVLGYGPGRLALGWWLLFVIEKPRPYNFEFGGYPPIPVARAPDPDPDEDQPEAEPALLETIENPDAIRARKAAHINEELRISGSTRLAKVIPVAPGTDFPVLSGIYQCHIPRGIKCVVAGFIGRGESYEGGFT